MDDGDARHHRTTWLPTCAFADSISRRAMCCRDVNGPVRQPVPGWLDLAKRARRNRSAAFRSE